VKLLAAREELARAPPRATSVRAPVAHRCKNAGRKNTDLKNTDLKNIDLKNTDLANTLRSGTALLLEIFSPHVAPDGGGHVPRPMALRALAKGARH
jgi:hypothetical protein